MSDLEAIKTRFAVLRFAMDEKLCRLWAAAEASAVGHGGISLVAAATGLSRGTISAGTKQLKQLQTDTSPIEVQSQLDKTHPVRTPQRRIRRPGGGSKLIEVKDPTLLADLERLIADEVAGDPMSERRWIRTTPHNLSTKLTAQGHQVGASTVRRLLRKLNFSLKGNKRKQIKRDCPERDEQFQYIALQKRVFGAARLPIISVDTKKKELIGDYRIAGKSWCREAPEVNEHDFPGPSKCRAVPFGVYDVTRNEGYVYVGVSGNTPEFVVEAMARWWKQEGRAVYPGTDQLLVLADSGGSNGCRARGWKHNIQVKLCNALQLIVTVCHYPTSCSKWNPVEHRLFSYISINWAGKPLRTIDTMLGYIRGTTTKKGLKVKAFLMGEHYAKGRKVTQEDMEGLNLSEHGVCPKWNYTLGPQQKPGIRGKEIVA